MMLPYNIQFSTPVTVDCENAHVTAVYVTYVNILFQLFIFRHSFVILMSKYKVTLQAYSELLQCITNSILYLMRQELLVDVQEIFVLSCGVHLVHLTDSF